ncbi:MAG TPA: serine hydrolase domain-containing protein, partial [Acidimicrobiia bacterium]
MSDDGLDPKGLTELSGRMRGHVASGAVPGLAMLVARGDDVHVEAMGRLGLERDNALERDAIFRIASLTKPITAASAMLLVDDGVLALDEPVDTFLPELAGRRVLRSLDAALDDTIPAHRAITVDDLLTCRFGLGCIMAAPGTYPIQKAEEDLDLHTFGPPWPPTHLSVDEWIERLGTLPLVHQPGEGWLYNTGLQVLGVLVERAAKMPFGDFLRRRLFAPLGMIDTSFVIDPSRRSRFTTAYSPDPSSGALSVLDPADGSWWDEPALANGAGWLLSTIDDFWAFVSMLVNGGIARGERVLSKAAVARMTMDHLHGSQHDDARLFVGPGASWGYGMAVPEAGESGGSVRAGYGWDGGTGTTWRTDPATGVTAILFTQRAMTSPEPPATFTDFYAALDAA